jgi:hypothetical protein
MIVMSYTGDGFVRACMETKKGRFVRDVFIQDIL